MQLNIDLGELPDEPEQLYALANVANVACGGHAGDSASMVRAIKLAMVYGTSIAAHPSYPDRANFGRVSMSIALPALRESVASQCAALYAEAAQQSAHVSMVKPHGALYHDANKSPLVAQAVLAGVLDGLRLDAAQLTVVGPPTGELAREAARLGALFHREGFADRGYAPDGSLIPRTAPGALLHDPAEAAAQARALASSGRFDTLCVHGDGARAVEIAAAVSEALSRS